jgi:hypothetical protein
MIYIHPNFRIWHGSIITAIKQKGDKQVTCYIKIYSYNYVICSLINGIHQAKWYQKTVY